MGFGVVALRLIVQKSCGNGVVKVEIATAFLWQYYLDNSPLSHDKNNTMRSKQTTNLFTREDK